MGHLSWCRGSGELTVGLPIVDVPSVRVCNCARMLFRHINGCYMLL